MKRVGVLQDGIQLPRIKVPRWVYEAMVAEANMSGVSMTDIVRMELADRYRDLLFDADAATRSPAVRAVREAVSVEEVES